MTNKPSLAGTGPQRDFRPALAPGVVLLASAALAWWAMALWSAHTQIQAAQVGAIAITLAASALPVVISAALVAGATVALTVTNLLIRRGVVGATAHFAAATCVGLALGLVGALVVNLGFDAGSARMVLAATTAAATTIGGATAGVRFPPAIGAMASATLVVFGVVFALGLFNDPLLSLFGAGDSQVSQLAAARWVARLASLAAGLVAGFAAFGYLRWAGRRLASAESGQATPRWPVYLVAGAGPGLLLLATEAIIRVGGQSLLASAGGLSEADGIAQRVLSGSRVDHAIAVLFVGALTTLIAFGKTLGSDDSEVLRAGGSDESEIPKADGPDEAETSLDTDAEVPQRPGNAKDESTAGVSP